MSLIRTTIDQLRVAFTPEAKPQGLVLALGAGGAAGLAHIGVLQVLAENNIPVRAVVGSSIGAEIGAFYASGMPFDNILTVALAFDWKQTLGMFLPDMAKGGLVSGTRIARFLRKHLGERRIEDLTIGYAAVAADLESGEQVVIDRGDLVEAVRASVSIPGLISPYRFGWRLLVDGGVLNPVPFDVARLYFGGPVVAVVAHSGGSGLQKPPPPPGRWLTLLYQLLKRPWATRLPRVRDRLRTRLDKVRARRHKRRAWNTRRVLDRALDISQLEIVRLRAERQAPDLMLVPVIGDVGTLHFHRAEEAIAAGRAAAQEQLAELKRLAGVTVRPT